MLGSHEWTVRCGVAAVFDDESRVVQDPFASVSTIPSLARCGVVFSYVEPMQPFPKPELSMRMVTFPY